jgi:hypothetical protein
LGKRLEATTQIGANAASFAEAHVLRGGIFFNRVFQKLLNCQAVFQNIP